MAPTSWTHKRFSLCDYLNFVLLIIGFLVSPIFGIFGLVIYALAYLLTSCLPGYGKFINYFDAWMEEDFVTAIPRNSVVTTMVLDGDLTLSDFKELFQKNVLEKKSSDGYKLRYPELQQYLTTFLGFSIWRRNSDFSLETHIWERDISHFINNNNNNNNSDKCDTLATIHQELLNLPYKKGHSPWEITLIRQVSPKCVDSEDNTSGTKSILACRMHHVLADGKSNLKLLVECLGQKTLKTAVPQSSPESWWNRLKFLLLFPINYLDQTCRVGHLMAKNQLHPWRVTRYWEDRDIKTVLAFSPKLSMPEIKQVAKKHGVTSSSVIMSVVAGAIQKCEDVLGDAEVAIGYPFPKPDHPEVLTNHAYMGFMSLPTNERRVGKRLEKCHQTFLNTKTSQQGRVVDLTAVLGGIQLFPITRLAVNHFAPTGITNIAGEEEGFSVGEKECVDFRLSVGTLGGVAGVVFCAFSYKDGIRVAVIAKESILTKDKAEQAALDVGQEFKILQAAFDI